MKMPLRSQLVLWAVLAIPGIAIAVAWAMGSLSYGGAVSETGEWAARILIVTLAITPLRLIFRRGPWLVWLVRRRRDFGVASFIYALAHTLIYLAHKLDFGLIVEEAMDWWLLAGWLAFLLFVPLALTSTDAAVRALKLWWKRLHRLVYLAAVLVFIHWVLSAFEPLPAYVHLGLLAVLEITRIVLQWRQRAAMARAA